MEREVQGDRMMIDVFELISTQLRGMWRFRWWAVALCWAICVLGWLFVYSMPNIYEANAKIYVDTENAIQKLLRDMVNTPNVMSDVSVVTNAMLSRPNLEEVARQTDLDLRTRNQAEFEDLLQSLQERIKITGSRDNVFSISFEDSNRAKAIAVVDSLLNTFIEESLGANRGDSQSAQAFLVEQIKDYETRLREAEDRLAQFKRENVALMPDQTGNYFERMQSAKAALEITRFKLRLEIDRRAELERQLEGEEPVFGIMPPTSNEPVTSTSARIRELEQELAELRLRYTDKHPQIGQTLEIIAQLKAQGEAASGGGPTGITPTTNPLDINPVYQNMKIQLSNSNVEIASLRSEVREQEAEAARLADLVDTVPQVEAELNRLDRDYDVVKAQYDKLLQRLESANLSDAVDQSIDDVQFRILEPPFSEQEAVGPQRELFMAGVLLASLAMAAALAFFLNQLYPVFDSARSISEVTGLPVLGTVDRLLSDSQRRLERFGKIAVAATVAVLLAAFTMVTLYADQGSAAVQGLAARLTL